MKNIFKCMGFAFSILITCLTIQAQTPANFTPASYQDAGRDKRIESTFPVVEQMKIGRAHV